MPFWSSWLGEDDWDIDGVEPPWGEAPSIHDHIVRHVRDGKLELAEGGEELPDEAKVRGERGLAWAPGAMDGAFGHHGNAEQSNAVAGQVYEALRALTRKATADHAAGLYTLLTTHGALGYLDALLQMLVEQQGVDAGRLHRIARWLATSAPDREPVKAAIALLGVVSGEEDRDLLFMLGRHEEFTLYSTVALQNRAPGGERMLYELARRVRGWGRVHLVERLAETKDDEIRAWMLREGYRNSIMYEYTALTCARTGGLLEALRLPHPDEALLRGAGDLLDALIRGQGGPAEGIEAYPVGAEVTELYLRYLRESDDLSLAQFLQVRTIRSFLGEDDAILRDPALGWPRRHAAILDHANAILDRPGWHEQVQRELETPDRIAFWTAAEAAKALDLDPWERYLERTRRGEDFWFNVMQTDEPGRVDRALALATEVIPLAEIATGPRDLLGIGPEYAHHHVLDWVLQGLGQFPGRGWEFIRAGLRSPVTRNRNMALRALANWPRDQWPEDAASLIQQVVAEEPNEQTRTTATKLRDGA